ncbi:hypothetical protein B7463_g1429, partial [Scytalidium lignicola]
MPTYLLNEDRGGDNFSMPDEPVTASDRSFSSRTTSSRAVSLQNSSELVLMGRLVDDLSLTPFANHRTTVNIRVKHDSGHAVFEVHRDLLFRHSPYLRNIFLAKRSFSKVSKRTRNIIQVKLPDLPNQVSNNIVHTIDLPQEVHVSPELFSAYLTWLYHGRTIIPQMLFSAETFIQLWVFAGKLGTAGLQNDCIEGIELWRARTRGAVQTHWLGWIYEHTSGDCGLRRLLIDQCVWELPAAWFRMNNEQFPDEALVDLTARLLEVVNSGLGQHQLWLDCPFLMAKG